MFRTTKLALSAAIILSTALSASAASKHHRVTDAHAALYNMVPGGGGGFDHAAGCGLSADVARFELT